MNRKPIMQFFRRIAGLCLGLILPAILACVILPGVSDARPLESILNRGVLLLCANPNALPFATKTGDRRGFELELGEALANQLGVKLEVGWVVFPNQIGRVDCDIILDAIVDQATASERHVKLSRPYWVSGVAIALRPGVSGVADYADLKKGQRVGAIVGSAASVTLGQKGLPTIPFTFEDDMIGGLATEGCHLLDEEPEHLLGGLEVRDPPAQGRVIADFESTEQMLRFFIQQVHRRRYFAKPRPVIPLGTQITRRGLAK